MSWVDVAGIVAGGLLLTQPANWLVRRVLVAARHESPQSQNKAGRWIGILERLLIYVLVLIGAAPAAGLVVAAKSILRFPEINAKPATIDPEYVLIGSLASWLLAFSVGALVATII